MRNFESTRFVIILQKRHVQVEAPDAATAKQRVLDGCVPGVVGREVLLFKTPFHCKEVSGTAAPMDVKATTDSDGCPVWVPVQRRGDGMLGDLLIGLAVLVLLCLYGSGNHAGPTRRTTTLSRTTTFSTRNALMRRGCLTARPAADDGILGSRRYE